MKTEKARITVTPDQPMTAQFLSTGQKETTNQKKGFS
jgi:hypothetical protein